MLRFNTDIGRLEVWRNDHWATILGETSASIAARGLYGGGDPDTNVIQYVTLATTGDSIDFGDLSRGHRHVAACASRTRAVFGGGYKTGPGATNVMEYVEVATLGNAVDFGDRSSTTGHSWGALSNSVRGLWISTPSANNVIDFFTFTSTGNTTDFGDNTFTVRDPAGLSSPTRGIIGGGVANNNDISYVTIASEGNAVDFGDLSFVQSGTGANYGRATGSNGVRGVFGPHNESPTVVYQYITISSTGNTQYFGDYLVSNEFSAGSSSSTRMIASGTNNPSVNNIDYIQIATTGDAKDFGDLIQLTPVSGCSNGHGGL